VRYDEGRELAVRYGCSFQELSAADCEYSELRSQFDNFFSQCIKSCSNVKVLDTRHRKRPVLNVSKMLPAFLRTDTPSVEKRSKSVASSLPDLASTIKDVFKKKEIKRYNIDILALSEIRWKGVGQETIDHGYVLLYSGEDNYHRADVGLMMSPAAYRTKLRRTPINERILFARLGTRHTKLFVIVRYAPTNEVDDDVKNSFYETLQTVTKDIPKHDVLCVVGDMNAKVGADRKCHPEVLGPHELGEINKNGALLLDFALSNDLVVRGSLLGHKMCTNTHGHLQTVQQKITRTWRTSLLDVCSYRKANAQLNHIFMISRIQIKLRAQKKTQQDLKKTVRHRQATGSKLHRDFCIPLWSESMPCYLDWQIRVYTNLPEEALLELNSTDVKFCNVSLLEHYLPYSFKDVNPRVWRFLALLDADINVVIFRDSDAIMLKREVDAVNEWLNSTKTYHVMRDHNFHKTKILAGMFGVKMIEKRSDIRQKAAKFISWSLNDKSKGTDQRLLANLFWDEVRKDSMIHDSFFCDYFKVEDGSDIRPFPTKRTNRKYIGNINNEFILEACPEKCMFGVKMIEKRSDIRQKAAKFISWSLDDKSKGTDQRLLANLFWDEVRKDSMIHDSFFCDYFKVEDGSDIRPFPTKRTNRKYIGNINNEFILEACPEK
ncbi:hypothetical protein QYM36_005319, partial [Artemia franciscana]